MEKVRDAIIAGWDATLLPNTPKYYDMDRADGIIDYSYSIGIRIFPSNESNGSTGKQGYKGDVRTKFRIIIKDRKKVNLQKMHKTVRDTINNEDVENAYWRIENWEFDYDDDNFECTINCFEYTQGI
jgi:hypothetical protein